MLYHFVLYQKKSCLLLLLCSEVQKKQCKLRKRNINEDCREVERFDRVSNKDLSEVQYLNYWIKRRKREWDSRVTRTNTNRDVKMARHVRGQGGSDPGEPHKC